VKRPDKLEKVAITYTGTSMQLLEFRPENDGRPY